MNAPRYLNVSVDAKHGGDVRKIAHQQLAGALVFNLQNLGAAKAKVWQVDPQLKRISTEPVEFEVPLEPSIQGSPEEHQRISRQLVAQEVGARAIGHMKFTPDYQDGLDYDRIILEFEPIFAPEFEAEPDLGPNEVPPGTPSEQV